MKLSIISDKVASNLLNDATPGKWSYILSNNATPFIMHENGDDACDVDDYTSLVCSMPAEIMNRYNSRNNARLIEKAPDLAHTVSVLHKVLNLIRIHALPCDKWNDDLIELIKSIDGLDSE
jgi:hypothetical protein